MTYRGPTGSIPAWTKERRLAASEIADQVGKSRWLRIQCVNHVFAPTPTTATAIPQAARENQPTVDRAGEVVASIPVASPVLGAQRRGVNGTARLQHAVPLVRGLELRGLDLRGL